MALHVRDPATDFAVRGLARITGKTLTKTIREAVEHQYAAINTTPPRTERLRLHSIQADFQAMKRSGGKPADKAFFDDLSGHT
jgi:antitoxin VapB